MQSHSGRTVSYDYLILATGSAAFVPPIPGVEKEGVFIYRTIEDLELIRDYASKAKTAAVIGGGLLGLEAAKAMIDLGIREMILLTNSKKNVVGIGGFALRIVGQRPLPTIGTES